MLPSLKSIFLAFSSELQYNISNYCLDSSTCRSHRPLKLNCFKAKLIISKQKLLLLVLILASGISPAGNMRKTLLLNFLTPKVILSAKHVWKLLHSFIFTATAPNIWTLHVDMSLKPCDKVRNILNAFSASSLNVSPLFSFFNFYLLIYERERKRNKHQFLVLLTYVLIGRFFCVP